MIGRLAKWWKHLPSTNLINVMRPELVGRKKLRCCDGGKKKRKNFGASNDLITEKLPPENDNQVER